MTPNRASLALGTFLVALSANAEPSPKMIEVVFSTGISGDCPSPYTPARIADFSHNVLFSTFVDASSVPQELLEPDPFGTMVSNCSGSLAPVGFIVSDDTQIYFSQDGWFCTDQNNTLRVSEGRFNPFLTAILESVNWETSLCWESGQDRLEKYK